MKTVIALSFAVVAAAWLLAAPPAPPNPRDPSRFPIPRPADPRERHLANVRQLTDGVQNAEAYFSFDGKRLIFQSTRPPFECDQIFTMDLNGHDVRLLSTGKGRCTCSYFFPDVRHYLYASTHLGGDACPPPPDMSHGYVWALYPAFDIFTASLDDPTPHRLTATPGYDAEATISPKGDRIIFTSVRDGDIDLYSMKLDGSDVRRITHEIGYDGGAFYSADGSKIIWRASRPKPGPELDEYKSLLAQGLIKPHSLDIYVANADGSDAHRLTDNGAANFAPFLNSAGTKAIFASNMDDPKRRTFDLYLINADGTGLERVTYSQDFNSFAMWSPEGKTLVFCSNRFDSSPHQTNVFLADWVE